MQPFAFFKPKELSLLGFNQEFGPFTLVCPGKMEEYEKQNNRLHFKLHLPMYLLGTCGAKSIIYLLCVPCIGNAPS